MPLDADIDGYAKIGQVRALIVRQLSRNADYQFLTLFKEKTDGSGYWETPKGKIEREETKLQAFYRELSEETGLMESQVKVLSKQPLVLSFDNIKDGVPTHTTAYVYAAKLIDPHAKVIVGRFENHTKYLWDSYGRTAMRLSHPEYIEQREGFLRTASVNDLVPKRIDSPAPSDMVRPIAKLASYSRR